MYLRGWRGRPHRPQATALSPAAILLSAAANGHAGPAAAVVKPKMAAATLPPPSRWGELTENRCCRTMLLHTARFPPPRIPPPPSCAPCPVVRRHSTGLGDTARHVLEHVVFLDDRRSFANVDALLTRVSTVYVACTEGGAAAAAAAQVAPWHRCVHRSDETRFRKLRWWKMGIISNKIIHSYFIKNAPAFVEEGATACIAPQLK